MNAKRNTTAADPVAQLRTEWMKSPAAAKALAGPYVERLIDVLDELLKNQVNANAQIEKMMAERVRYEQAFRRMLDNQRVATKMPVWMMVELRNLVVGEEPQNG